MKTIALRFGDYFAPECGTIAAHQIMIDKVGYVWYGKMGAPISTEVAEELMSNEKPRILLIHSGGFERYWAYIEDISREIPPKEYIPAYYRDMSDKFKTWFKITRIESAPKDIMSKCFVRSSNTTLSMTSRHSMSPYFKIQYNEEA